MTSLKWRDAATGGQNRMQSSRVLLAALQTLSQRPVEGPVAGEVYLANERQAVRL